ncbi:DUF6894 family protein [Glacieibacterium frigidum]|uniref:DUF6894 domain-containing protein n=1 Tax=Glacieibacterium frigidum TaxID=2593303 RepID=A0A552U988_9SPHN|nr:hypothetical protein [Glacieibacterium frigidum]TRW14778.1 hypothetical protein FMM06_13945 [Glacieibacterium frigidum]
MAIFFTHSSLGSDLAEDREGNEFDDLQSARRDALMAGRLIVADEIRMGSNAVDLKLYVDDERGNRVATLTYTAMVVSL